MIDLRFRPLEAPKPKARKRAPFKAGYKRTLDDLERELKHLQARNIVIEAGFDLNSIRNDGWPYSNAKPNHPAVAVSATTKHGPVRWPCDTYDDWQDNLRAISLALEALRAVDRYGVTQGGEQYRGWAALPAPGQSESGQIAARVLASHQREFTAAQILASSEAYQAALKIAYRATHPDTGAPREAWDRVQEAKVHLDAHHKLKNG